jgi:oligosaccharide repeat unit polymerase
VRRRPTAPLRGDGSAIIFAFLPVLISLTFWWLDLTGTTSLQATAVISFTVAIAVFWRMFWGLGITAELPSLIFVGGMLFWFYVPALALAVEGDRWLAKGALISGTERHWMQAFVATNTVLFLLVALTLVRFSKRFVDRIARRFGRRRPAIRFGTLAVLSTIALVCLLFYVIASGGPAEAIRVALGSRTVTGAWERQAYEGTALTALNVVFVSGLLASGTIAASYSLMLGSNSPKPVFRISLVIIAVIAIGWIALSTGTRSYLLMGGGPAFLLLLRRIKKDPLEQGSRSNRAVVIAVLIIGALVLTIGANAQRKYRYEAEIEDGVSFEIDDNNMLKMAALAFAIQEKEDRFIYDSALLHIISGPIPRAIWANKPVMESMFVFTRWVWGRDTTETGGNTLPSLVGQYYMNWGWPGILEIGLVLGLLLRFCDQLFAASEGYSGVRLGTVALAMYLFVSTRMLSFAFFAPMGVTVLLATLVTRVRLRSRRSSAMP